MIQNTAILVFACDRYQMLYEGFIYFFEKYWPSQPALPLYFATEDLQADLRPFRLLNSGKGEWSSRLRNILHQIEEKNVIMLQEDMWLNRKLSGKILQQSIEYAEAQQIPLLKYHSSEVYSTRGCNVFFEGLQLSEVDKKLSGFLMSHQVSFWNVDFLLAQLQKDEHPWRNERRGTKRLKKRAETIYHLDLLAENGKAAINQNRDEEGRGSYLTVSVNATLHPKAAPLLDELAEDKPEYAARLHRHMVEGITHDGKAHPRKIDIFKKIKNKLKG